MRLPPGAWIDLEAAERGAGDAQAALSRGDAEEALEAACEALEIARRPLLPELEGDWLDERRRELSELATSLLELSGRAALDLGGEEVSTAEGAGRKLVGREPFREPGYRLLMEAHARRGNVAEALRVFEDLRTLLRDELGTSPSLAILELHGRLLRGEAGERVQTTPRAPHELTANKDGIKPHVGSGPPPVPPLLVSLDRRAFVGRARELEALREAWRQAQAGECRLILLAGEPGIGKTRLAARLAHEIHDEGDVVLYGRSDEGAPPPYQPLVEALRHLVAEGGAFEPAGLEAELSELVRLIPELRGQVTEPAEPIPSEPGWARLRLFEAVSVLLARAARERPVLLILDDLHWAERPTLLLLRHLLRPGAGSRLLVLATYRDVEVSASHPLADALADLRREGPVVRLDLGGLDEPDVARLVRTRSEAAKAPRELVRSLRERTDGNPFFLEETLRSLDEVGGGSEYVLDDLGVPAGVREVVARRVGRLEEETRETLTLAAVVGRDFRLGVIEALLGAPGEQAIAALEEAIAAGLLVETAEIDRFSFCHALVREALYEQLSAARRRRLHRRIGEALEDLPEAEPAELAGHFFAARHLGCARKAVEWSIAAGERAVEVLAYEEAATHYGRALEAMELESVDESERCEALLALGSAQGRAGDPATRETLQRAAASARARGAAEQLARAALGLGGRYHEAVRADEPELSTLLREALTALGPEDSVLRTRVLAQLAEVLHFAASRNEPEALSLDALEAARRLGDREALVAALFARHVTLLHIRHLDKRLAVSEELLSLAQSAGDRDLLGVALHLSIHDLTELGDLKAARQRRAELSALQKELAQSAYAQFALHQLRRRVPHLRALQKELHQPVCQLPRFGG